MCTYGVIQFAQLSRCERANKFKLIFEVIQLNTKLPKKVLRRGITIPTITLTKSDLRRLSEIFESAIEEYIITVPDEEITNKRKYDPEYLLPSYEAIFMDLRVEDNNYSEIEANWKENLYKIKMSFNKYKDNNIEISFDFKSPQNDYNNYITISGENETWVLGIEQKFNEFFKSIENLHYLLYGHLKHAIRVVIGFPFLYFILILLVITSRFFGGPTESTTISGIDYVQAYIILLLLSYFCGWQIIDSVISKIFPKIEYYNEKNLRNQLIKILSIIITLISGAMTIYSFIQSIL